MLTVAEDTLQRLAKEHDKHVSTHLYGQFQDNDSFRKWLSEKVFALTYGPDL